MVRKGKFMVFEKTKDGQIINGNIQVKEFPRFLNALHAESGHDPGRRSGWACGVGEAEVSRWFDKEER